MKKRRSPFTHEDRHLWKRVAETVTPLSSQNAQAQRDELERLMADDGLVLKPAQPTIPRPPKSQAYRPPTPAFEKPRVKDHINHPIEERVVKKLAKGRQSIDSRIDLHGMTQDRARFALQDFLQMAQASDHRIVLVITGKGNEGRGVLRNNVPQWLGLHPFAQYVNGFRTSHISHGGDGALYVRIRKPAARRSR